MTAAVQTLPLADGRTLAWREYGDPTGVPCLYTTGTPASGLAGQAYDAAARRHGVRWVSLDKPGYGGSTNQRGRSLLQWPRDVTELADHLALDRFAVLGESGGGPHVLALAHAIPDRLTTAVTVAGLGPFHDPVVRRGMKRGNRILLALANRAPWLLPVPVRQMARSMSDPQRRERYLARQLAAAPAPDRQVFGDPGFRELGVAATLDAFAQGPDGAVEELRMFARPWGFRLEDVRGHVDLFHGEHDVNVPVAIARTVAAALPDCTARIYPDCGHAVAVPKMDEILTCVRSAA